MTKCAIRLAMFVGFSVSPFAQLAPYNGPPLAGGVFIVRPGIEMVVDWGPSKQVCRIHLPSGRQYGGTAPEGAVTKRQIDEVLQEVAPSSMRGKETGKMVTSMGSVMI